MKINQFITNFLKKLSDLTTGKVFFIFGSIVFVAIIYSSILYNSYIKQKRSESIRAFLDNNQTVLLKNYILNQIKSPYLEYDYVVKNNDTIDSILKKFSINNEEINFIVKKIKQMGLSRINPDQKISFVLKKGKKSKDVEIVRINYPLSKTTSVIIDKKKKKYK